MRSGNSSSSGAEYKSKVVGLEKDQLSRQVSISSGLEYDAFIFNEKNGEEIKLILYVCVALYTSGKNRERIIP